MFMDKIFEEAVAELMGKINIGKIFEKTFWSNDRNRYYGSIFESK